MRTKSCGEVVRRVLAVRISTTKFVLRQDFRNKLAQDDVKIDLFEVS